MATIKQPVVRQPMLWHEVTWWCTLLADRLQCSICNGTEGDEDFLLCDSCAQGYHAISCLHQELPSTRFWWCPDCSRRGLTIKGLILQVNFMCMFAHSHVPKLSYMTCLACAIGIGLQQDYVT